MLDEIKGITPFTKLDDVKKEEPIKQEIAPKKAAVAKSIYPKEEEMTFKALVASEEHGLALLQAVQMVINTYGADSIITMVKAIDRKPRLAAQIKAWIPYLGAF